MLRRADLALDAAKIARGAIVRYHPVGSEFDPQRLGLISELRRAIGGGELELHYQPKIDVPTGRVTAFEALVRWNHPVRGLLPPVDFIPIAESTGLIGPLTQWVVDAALAQLCLEGYPVRDEDVARLSPFVHEHINLLGRYTFAVPESVTRGELRPLRSPKDA